MAYRLASERPFPALAGIVLAAALASAFSSACAKTAQEVQAACRAEHRPCVGLVLSGGGARGFAHVGVIKVLEELGVKIDVVTGTSMGSMVGGAYAAGFSIDELERTVLEVDWDQMLAPNPSRRLTSWRQKLDDYKGLPSSGLEVSPEGSARLPESFVPSQELELFLARKTAPVDMVEDLSMLAIPFAAAATNLVTGDRVVMQKGCTLGQAMRASMSIPGAFAPAKFNGELLVDGGLVDNLPVALAREMGADVVIAVNVGTPLSGRDELTNVVGVMAQMVNLLTEQNVTKSLSELTDSDILIQPDLTGFTSADLKRSREIIDIGEAAGKAVAGRLARFASSSADWSRWNEARTAAYRSVNRKPSVISEILVAQNESAAVPPERIVEQAAVPLREPVGRRRLDDAVRTVWADGYFESVTYRLDPGPDGTSTLVIEPKEKEAGYSSVRLGGSLETDFDSVSTFNLLFAHTWHLLNAWGGEWRNEIQVGDEQRFYSEFYQPLGNTLPIFVMPKLSYERQSYDAYVGNQAVATLRNTLFDAQVLFGWESARLGYAGISFGWLSARSDTLIGRDSPPWRQRSAPYVGGEFFFDTLDSISFPTSGLHLEASAKTASRETGDAGGSHLFSVSALVPWSIGRWTAVGEAEISRSNLTGAFQLGGAGRMVGVPYGRWSGSRLEYARLSLSRNISDYVPLKLPVWVGLTGEAGRAWDDAAGLNLNEDPRKWHKSVSASLGVDSPIGPVFLIFGRTMDEGTGIYFRWGYRQ